MLKARSAFICRDDEFLSCEHVSDLPIFVFNGLELVKKYKLPTSSRECTNRERTISMGGFLKNFVALSVSLPRHHKYRGAHWVLKLALFLPWTAKITVRQFLEGVDFVQASADTSTYFKTLTRNIMKSDHPYLFIHQFSSKPFMPIMLRDDRINFAVQQAHK